MPSRPRIHRPTRPATRRHQLPEENRQARRELHTGRKEWRAIRAFVLERDRYRCQRRGCGRTVVGRHAHVDHVDGDSTNNPPDGSNWQTLCDRCHSAKTARETRFGRNARPAGPGMGRGRSKV